MPGIQLSGRTLLQRGIAQSAAHSKQEENRRPSRNATSGEVGAHAVQNHRSSSSHDVLRQSLRPDYGHDRAIGTPRSESSSTPKDAGAYRHNTFLNVAVIVERDDDGERLIRELQKLRCTVRHIWPMPPQLPLQYEAIFCAIRADLPQRVPWVPGEPAAALILVDTGREPLDFKLIHNCATHGMLHYPATPRATQAALMLAREHFLYERRLRGRIDKLDENLRTMRVVERAKALLMRLKNLSEEDAYNLLRKQAMERRVGLGAVARAIIDSHELLG